MFVTNKTKLPLGIDGIIILKPKEENRFIEDSPELVERAKRLEAAGLASVSFEAGLVKPTAEAIESPEAPEAPEAPETLEQPKVPTLKKVATTNKNKKSEG